MRHVLRIQRMTSKRRASPIAKEHLAIVRLQIAAFPEQSALLFSRETFSVIQAPSFWYIATIPPQSLGCRLFKASLVWPYFFGNVVQHRKYILTKSSSKKGSAATSELGGWYVILSINNERKTDRVSGPFVTCKTGRNGENRLSWVGSLMWANKWFSRGEGIGGDGENGRWAKTDCVMCRTRSCHLMLGVRPKTWGGLL